MLASDGGVGSLAGGESRANGGRATDGRMLLLCLKPQGTAHFSFVQTDLVQLCSRYGPVKSVTPFVFPSEPPPVGEPGLSIALALVCFIDDSALSNALALHDTPVPCIGVLLAHEVTEENITQRIRMLYEAITAESTRCSNNVPPPHLAGQHLTGSHLSGPHLTGTSTVGSPHSLVVGPQMVGSMPAQAVVQHPSPLFTASPSSTAGPASSGPMSGQMPGQMPGMMQYGPPLGSGLSGSGLPGSGPPGAGPPGGPAGNNVGTHFSDPSRRNQSGGSRIVPRQVGPNAVGPNIIPGPLPHQGSGHQGEFNYWVARLEFVNLFGAEGFNVTQAVLGPEDSHIHFILRGSENCVSVSLKGVPANEAPVQDRLHMAIQSNVKMHFDRAVDMAEDLLQVICQKFVAYCVANQIPIANNAGFIRHLYGGVQLPDSREPPPLRYLSNRERPRVWLHDVPPELLCNPSHNNPGHNPGHNSGHNPGHNPGQAPQPPTAAQQPTTKNRRNRNNRRQPLQRFTPPENI